MNELIVLLAAATPILEVRASVPLGLGFGLSPFTIILLSIIGSVLPVILILWGLNVLTYDLRKIKTFDKFFDWLFTRTRAKSDIIKNWEAIGLAIFIAVPLPGTGVWTGCVAAYLFGLSWTSTFIASLVGTSIATIAVYWLSIMVIKFI